MNRILSLLVFLLLGAERAWSACTGSTPNLGLIDCATGTPPAIYEPAWITNFLRLDFAFSSPLVITGVGSPSPTVSLGTVGETKGGTGQTSYVTGDTLTASATNTLSKLSPNITTTKKFRCQQGNGAAVTTDGWCPASDAVLGDDAITSVNQIDEALCASGEVLREDSGTAWACRSVSSLASDLLPGFPNGSNSLTPGSISANSCTDVSLGVTVQNAASVQATTGNPCVLGVPAAGAGNNISATCYVDTTGSVQVRFCNSATSSNTATSGTYKVKVLE